MAHDKDGRMIQSTKRALESPLRGAAYRNRTDDLLITSETLYRLS